MLYGKNGPNFSQSEESSVSANQNESSTYKNKFLIWFPKPQWISYFSQSGLFCFSRDVDNLEKQPPYTSWKYHQCLSKSKQARHFVALKA